jgi:hypothetical protein
MVPEIGAHAEDTRIARLAACGEGSGVEPGMMGSVRVDADHPFFKHFMRV